MKRTSPIVLVHGGFQSAQTWYYVVARRSDGGCLFVVATLTGLVTDSRALSEEVTLDTHIGDVVSLLEGQDLRDVILVGHSYAGMIITGVAERVRDRIEHLVYVDALVPDHGQ